MSRKIVTIPVHFIRQNYLEAKRLISYEAIIRFPESEEIAVKEIDGRDGSRPIAEDDSKGKFQSQ